MRKNFIDINEGFVCEQCGRKVPPVTRTCRNHCSFCLYSKHVDEFTPGDRESMCGGLMRPLRVEYDGKKGTVIIFRCEKCHKEGRNKAADDDHLDILLSPEK